MTRLMLLIFASILFIGAIAIFTFLLWPKLPAIQGGSLALGDLVNLLVALLTMVGLAIALGSFYIAIVTYQKSIKDGEAQQKNLDASRAQLQAVVDVATAQQEILKKNLEISRAQQELLSKSLGISKIQQELQTKSLETSKAQLSVLEEQQKREAERQARKPIAEISLKAFNTRYPLDSLEKQGAIEFRLEKDKNWQRIEFLVSNSGNIEISRPLISIAAVPKTITVDSADIRYPQRSQRGGSNVLQIGGSAVLDIDPIEVAQVPYSVAVDISVIPDSIDAFVLTFSIQAKNLTRKTHTLHFKVTRPSS